MSAYDGDEQSGDAFSAGWTRDLGDLAESARWSGYADTVWSERVDEGSVRYAAQIAEPPSEKEWAEAVAGAVVAS